MAKIERSERIRKLFGIVDKEKVEKERKERERILHQKIMERTNLACDWPTATREEDYEEETQIIIMPKK